MRHFALLLALFCTACGTKQAPELQPYIEIMMSAAKQWDAIPIELYDLDFEIKDTLTDNEGVAAYAQCGSANHRAIIRVERDFWENGKREHLEAIMMHELGHCVLGRDHYDDLDQNGKVISIMSTKSNNVMANYEAGREYYLWELVMKGRDTEQTVYVTPGSE